MSEESCPPKGPSQGVGCALGSSIFLRRAEPLSLVVPSRITLKIVVIDAVFNRTNRLIGTNLLCSI